MKSFKKNKIKLTASLKAVIAQFHHLPNNGRVNNIIKRVEALNENEVDISFKNVTREFVHRHPNFYDLLMDNFNQVHNMDESLLDYSETTKLLLGEDLTKEYSCQSAA